MKDCRLQKYISDSGLMSRRSAEKEIEAGNFTVNGVTAEIGMKIDPINDVVEYKGKPVTNEKPNGYTYIMLNKPKGYVTTMSDEKGRKCVAELVADLGIRVYPVGRLDYNSEGLLLMTNDGAFTEQMTHPKHEIPKIYHVRIKGDLSGDDLARLSAPMRIDGYEIQGVDCRVIERKHTSTVVEMTLYEGRNRQIRKMCEQTGLTIRSLKRVAIGNLTLSDLGSGKWRPLTASQVKYLIGKKDK
ncbi:MAG: rRNA pseudouridine synthase [Ruminococcaceae bacterium]|nr:rRNA pseudouridine synthase [Oscillospiraceae bacterium]